jgi:hypothetical protein
MLDALRSAAPYGRSSWRAEWVRLLLSFAVPLKSQARCFTCTIRDLGMAGPALCCEDRPSPIRGG